MTTLEALQSKIGINYPNLEMSAKVALIGQGLTGTELYVDETDPANPVINSQYIEPVDIACAGLILTVISSADISEAGYSIKLGDRNALLNLRKIILNQYGLSDDSLGSISNVSYLW